MTISSLNNTNNIYAQLSSGKKINKAADDAAGMAIAQKLNVQTGGLDQGSKNIASGIDAVKIADGALSTVSDSLNRINELSIQASNGLMSASDKASIQQEIDGLIQGIDQIGASTKYNETYLLDGSAGDIHIAANPDGSGPDIAMQSSLSESLGIAGYNVTGDFDMSKISDALSMVSKQRSSYGASQNGLEYSYAQNQITRENVMASSSRLEDLDFAKGVTEQQKKQLMNTIAIQMQKKKQEDEAQRHLGLFQ